MTPMPIHGQIQLTADDVRNRPETGGRAQQFVLHTEFEPAGDQPTAITELSTGIVLDGDRDQVLLGATGTGKTFTMAKVIEETQRPAIILAPNKTLAAQLYGEFKGFFPDNAVEYFVSYYDYYQPEAYVPRSDTYIEKESQINEQIDRMRHSATRALSGAGRCDHRGLGVVYLRYRFGRDLRRDDPGSEGRATSYDQRQVMARIWSPSSTAATIWRFSAARSGCGATAGNLARPP